MSEIGPGNPPPLPSEEIRYDLNGNPLPSSPRVAAAPPPPPPNPYAAAPPSYGAAPPPPPSYAPPPPSASYAPPPSPPPAYNPPPPPQYNPGPSPYGAPPQGYSPGVNPPGYGPPGAPNYGAPQAQGTPDSKIWWYVAIGFAVVAVLMVVIFGVATKPPHVDAPAIYKPVDSPDKAFTCTGPDGWETIGAGVEGSDEGGLLFKKEKVKIDITDSSAMSFMGDIVKSPGGMGDDPNAPPPPPPVVKMHDMMKSGFAERYGDYVEQDAQPLQVPFGDTRISEWTAKGSLFTGKLHGYRVTMLGQNKEITVDCHCPEANWETMKPVFLKVVQSITAGSG